MNLTSSIEEKKSISDPLSLELLNYFIESLKNANSTYNKKNPQTINRIEQDIKSFLFFCESQKQSSINADTVSEYITKLNEEYRETSFLCKVSSLRQFTYWLNLEHNPFWKLKFKTSLDDFQSYSYDEIFENFNQEVYSLDLLVVSLIYELYLSAEELLNIKLKDLNQASKSLTLRGSELEISAETFSLLKIYLEKEASSNIDLDKSIFTNSDKAFNSATISNIFKSMNLKSSYVKRSRIIHLLDQGATIAEVEQKLATKVGNLYSNFEQEKSYRLLNAYKQFHPRAYK